MRKTINILAVLLAVVVLLSPSAYAAGSDQITPYESSTLRQYTTFLYVPSGNEIQIWFDVIGTRILDKIGVLRIEVQQSSDGQNWTTVEAFRCTDYDNMIATNSQTCCSYVTYYGTYGYYYRAYVTIMGQKGTEISSRFIYTDTVYLRSYGSPE